jgi:hypothetical protein
MPANQIRSRPASEGDFTITQTEEHPLQEQISHLTKQVDALNQLLDQYRRQGVSSTSHRSQTQAVATHQAPASTSGLISSGDGERHFPLKLL